VKIIYRIYSGIIICIISAMGMIYFATLPNWQEMWGGIAFSMAVLAGFIIYVISNYKGLKEIRSERKKLRKK
jgi:hypothetical protein